MRNEDQEQLWNAKSIVLLDRVSKYIAEKIENLIRKFR